MSFEDALLAEYKGDVDSIVKTVGSPRSNCCVFGLNHCARELVLDAALRQLKKEPKVNVVESKLDEDSFLRPAEGGCDPCCAVVDNCLSQLGAESTCTTEILPRKIDSLKHALSERYKKSKQNVIICLRHFDNVRYLPAETFRGFLLNLAKINDWDECGNPRVVIESSRSFVFLKSPESQWSYETTGFERAFPIRNHVWIKPLAVERVGSLFKRLKCRHGSEYIRDVYRRTFGVAELVKMVYDGSPDEDVDSVFLQVAKSIQRLLDMPCSAAIGKRSWFDVLMNCVKGDSGPCDAKIRFRKYGLIDAEGRMPECLKEALLQLHDNAVADGARLNTAEKDRHFMRYEFPESVIPGYTTTDGDRVPWMRVGRFLIKRDWSKIRLFHDKSERVYEDLVCKRSAKGRGNKDCSDNEKGICLLSYFINKYKELSEGEIPLNDYYEKAPTKHVGAIRQLKSEWRRYLTSSKGLQEFFKDQMKSTRGQHGKPCWGILPDAEWSIDQKN